MKNNWLKYWTIVIVLAIFSYIIFHQLPDSILSKINLPGVIIDPLWNITSIVLFISLLLGILVKVIKPKKIKKTFWVKWKVITSFLATILVILFVLCFSFAVEGKVVSSLISDTNNKDIPFSNYDERCVFMPGYFIITHENGSNYFSLDVDGINNPAYKNKLGKVFYSPDRNFAIAQGHDSSQLALLDFNTCLLSLIPPVFNIKNTEFFFFGQSFISLSPDDKYVLFEVDLRMVAPEFDGTWPSSVSSDVSKNGFWIYSLHTKKSTQIHQIKNAVDTNDVEIKWGTDSLSIFGADCPETGCQFDLIGK